MSWAGFKAADAYVGTRLVAWNGPAGNWCSPADGLEDAVEQLGQRMKAERAWMRRPVRLWWSGGLCRPYLLRRPEHVAGEQELAAVAKAMAAQMTGLVGPCRVWMEETTTAAERVVVAVEETTWLRCTATVEGAGWKLASAGPWWAEVLHTARARKNAEVVGIQDCDSLTVFAGNTQSFDLATTYAPIADEASAEAVWRRAVSMHLSAGATVSGASRAQLNAGVTTSTTLNRKARFDKWVEFLA